MSNRKNNNIKDDEEAILAILDKNSQEDLFLDIPHPKLVCVNPRNFDETTSNTMEDSEQIDDPDHDGNWEPNNEGLQSSTDSSQNVLSDNESECYIIEPPAKRPKVDHRGRGRVMDKVWEEFNAGVNITPSKVKCRHCGDAVSKKVERLRTHLDKCKKYRTSVSDRHASQMSLQRNSPSCWSPSTSLKPPINQPKATSFVDRLSKQEQDDINLEIGRYIYTLNLPFTHAEHPAFIRMFTKCRPAFKAPCRQTIGGPILEKTYNEVIKQRERILNGKYAVILQDGWKTRTSEPVIAHSIVAGGKSLFLNAVPTEHNQKTSKYCFKLLAETIGRVNAMGANVIAVVTDNCSSMEKMRRIVGEQYPGMFTYGCHAHLLNLIGKKFTPDDVMERVQKVHNYFRNHDAAAAILKGKKVGRPVIPSATRWNAWQKTFEYYLAHQTTMLESSRDPNAAVVEDEIVELLNDAQLYSDVQSAVKRMKPIQVAIDKVQRESAILADGVSEWLKLRAQLEIQDIESQQYFDKQFERALQPVGIASYMLHPTYRGAGLDSDLVNKGNKFLSDINPFFIIVAAQLQLQSEDYFPKEMFCEKALSMCSAATWWTSQKCFNKISPDVNELGIKLSQLPAGSADIERHFSTLGNIMSIRRARLGIDKASKLCTIYKHFNDSSSISEADFDWEHNI